MNWLRKLFGRGTGKPPVPVETLIKQEANLTDEEDEFIGRTGKCPDCKKGTLLAGPEGVCSVNCKCDNWDCRHEFNVVPGMMGHRLNRDMPMIYGMTKE